MTFSSMIIPENAIQIRFNTHRFFVWNNGKELRIVKEVLTDRLGALYIDMRDTAVFDQVKILAAEVKLSV